jgi:hypothetical protein
MNLTLDYPNKTITLNGSVKADDLLNFIQRNALLEWTIKIN